MEKEIKKEDGLINLGTFTNSKNVEEMSKLAEHIRSLQNHVKTIDSKLGEGEKVQAFEQDVVMMGDLNQSVSFRGDATDLWDELPPIQQLPVEPIPALKPQTDDVMDDIMSKVHLPYISRLLVDPSTGNKRQGLIPREHVVAGTEQTWFNNLHYRNENMLDGIVPIDPNAILDAKEKIKKYLNEQGEQDGGYEPIRHTTGTIKIKPRVPNFGYLSSNSFGSMEEPSSKKGKREVCVNDSLLRLTDENGHVFVDFKHNGDIIVRGELILVDGMLTEGLRQLLKRQKLIP